MSKISDAFKSLWQSVKGVVLAHPAVSVMLVYACVAAVAVQWVNEGMWAYPMPLVPLAAILALGLDYLLPGRLKGLSWVMVALLALTAFIPGVDKWTDSMDFMVATFVIAPLIVLIFRKSVSNESFIRNALWTLWSLCLALALAALLFLVAAGIIVSIKTLFATGIERPLQIDASICFVLVAPMLFVGLSEREDIPSISRLVDIIINWILSPALVVYTLVLFAYMSKILLTWSLPCGGVAVMCFIWGMAMLLVAASQSLLGSHPFSWLVKSYGYLAIPLMVMLWVAIGRRLVEYGITPQRYFLVLCGLTMTVATAISLFKVRNGYFMVAAIMAALFTLGLVMPGVNYRSATVASQLHRAKAVAREIGLLADDGSFLKPMAGGDDGYSEGVTAIHSSLKAIKDVSSKAFLALGVDSINEYDNYDSGSLNERTYLCMPSAVEDVCIDGFQRASFNLVLDVGSDDAGRRFITLGDTKVFLDEIMAAQMEKTGLTDADSVASLNDHEAELLVYEHPAFTIYIRNMNIMRDRDGKYVIDEDYKLNVLAVLFR